MKLVVQFAAFRRIWPAPALALVLVVGGSAVPASADTLIPLPLPSMAISLPGINLSPNAPAPTQAPSVEALEATLLIKLNAERAAAGLGALALQPWASSVARGHSKEMAAARDIWHNHTGYLDIAKHTIGAYLTGENVAEAGTLDEADSLLVNSPPHRANILYPAFNYVGIGVAVDAGSYVYVTQDFVTIKPAQVSEVAAVASPAAPVATAPRVAAAAVPVPPRSIPKPATAVAAALPTAPAAALPELSPLAASPVVATGLSFTRRLEGRLPVFTRRLEGRLGPTNLPVVVWAIVLTALAGVLHTRSARRTPGRTPNWGNPTRGPDYGT